MNNYTEKEQKEFALAAQNNFEDAFRYRHSTRADIWGLADEIVEKALEMLEEWGLDYAKNEVALMYDNFAINAGIIAKEDTEEDFDPTEAIFETEHYYVMTW